MRSLLGRFRPKPIDVTPAEDAAAPETSGTIEQDRGDTIETAPEAMPIGELWAICTARASDHSNSFPKL